MYLPKWETGTIATREFVDSRIDAVNPAFSNAVLAVGLNIDTNSVAALNEIASTFGGFPIEGTASTLGGILVALAAAIAWLKKNKADKPDGYTVTLISTVEDAADGQTEVYPDCSLIDSKGGIVAQYKTDSTGVLRLSVHDRDVASIKDLSQMESGVVGCFTGVHDVYIYSEASLIYTNRDRSWHLISAGEEFELTSDAVVLIKAIIARTE